MQDRTSLRKEESHTENQSSRCVLFPSLRRARQSKAPLRILRRQVDDPELDSSSSQKMAKQLKQRNQKAQRDKGRRR